MSRHNEFSHFCVVLLFVFIATASCFVFYGLSATDATFTVYGKERVSMGKGDSLRHKYLVYTEKETFEVTDSWSFFRFDSADRYGRLQKDASYKATVAGWRIPFCSTYRNIIEAKPSEPEASN